ncbi:MAG: hypothetical protein PVF85_01625 [Anaerolineales bacterium]
MRHVFALVFLASLLAGCSALLRRPEPGIEVIEKVEICFRQDEQAHLLATARPSDCYSMRCTRQNFNSGTAILDQGASRLDFKVTFNLSRVENTLLGCGEDCVGGGTLNFDLGLMPVGLYRVYLWDTYLGDLSVTSGLPWHDQCLP